jgi:hypothetical protein
LGFAAVSSSDAWVRPQIITLAPCSANAPAMARPMPPPPPVITSALYESGAGHSPGTPLEVASTRGDAD